ncbi:OLC1v1030992C1 [Oldenlandia corymbosa var. corymbosa]|uniref:OLC1v1030992C1 n=1 Tax=Oldenlandia corymbosa var. corymbosa TaxID=529605 RepID=A0AAV1CHC7_OLDCO|nr:OLC1v1030992C1 [Oldenlandia corymbosa var. corymbosa]
MEKRLYEAAVIGNTDALSDLIKENPKVLDRNYMNSEGDKNALHYSSMFGHEGFVKAILTANDSSIISRHMCLAGDRNGRNPLHLAAMHGQLNILRLIHDHDGLIQAALAKKADGGNTILHLCVEHNQLEALKLLLDTFTDPEFRSAKNEDGMTILHLAIYHNHNQRRREIIIYLIDKVPEIINTSNANGKTAWDLFLEQANIEQTLSLWLLLIFNTRRLRRVLNQSTIDNGIVVSLLKTKAFAHKNIVTRKGTKHRETLEKRKDAIMVVASIIATMAFQVMLSPPGGIWQDNLLEGSKPHRAGQSIMAQAHRTYYKQLIGTSSTAFVASLSVIILLARGWNIHQWIFFAISTTLMWLSVASIAVAYGIALVTITPESLRGSLTGGGQIAIIVIMLWAAIFIAWAHGFLPDRVVAKSLPRRGACTDQPV